MAGRPARSFGSRLLDGCSEPAERSTQVFVSDLGEVGRNPCGRFGVATARRCLRATAQRGLTQPQAADRLPAEEAIHPFEHHAGEVLDLSISNLWRFAKVGIRL